DGEVTHIGPQIIRDLALSNEEEIKSNKKRGHRKAMKMGVTLEFDDTGERLEDFLNIYYGTMDRLKAEEYYFFKPEFFKKIQKNLQGHFVYALAKLNGKVISAKLILFDQTFSYF